MNKFPTFTNSSNANLILDLLKLCFIAFFAFSVVAHMWPYFYGSDTSLYGTAAINLVNGQWGIQNDLLKKTGLWEFVPLSQKPFTMMQCR